MEKERIKGQWPADWQMISESLIHIPLTLPTPLHNGTLAVTLGPEYPFRVPTACYNGTSLALIYRTGNIFQEDMKLVSGLSCLCCHTYLCRDNWHCTHQIKDIVREFLNVVAYKIRIVERFVCKRIQEKYLHNIPIHEFL